MKIKIDDKTYIESDGMQFIVKKYTGNFTVDKKGVEREGYQALGYYGTIEQLISGLVNKKILKSKATNFEELSRDIQKAKRDITKLIKGD